MSRASIVPGVPDTTLAVGVVLLAGGAWLLTRRPEDIGAGIVRAGAGAVDAGMTVVSESLGIPAPADVTDDPAVARWIMDHPKGGYFAASLWSTPIAFARALALSESDAAQPADGTKARAAFPESDFYSW